MPAYVPYPAQCGLGLFKSEFFNKKKNSTLLSRTGRIIQVRAHFLRPLNAVVETLALSLASTPPSRLFFRSHTRNTKMVSVPSVWLPGKRNKWNTGFWKFLSFNLKTYLLMNWLVLGVICNCRCSRGTWRSGEWLSLTTGKTMANSLSLLTLSIKTGLLFFFFFGLILQSLWLQL